MRLSRDKQSGLGRPWTQNSRSVLSFLIAINVAVFVAQLFVDQAEPALVRDYLALSKRGVLDAYSWQFFTGNFVFASAWQFLGNIVLLFVLGRDLETILGRRHFLYLFVTGAIAGDFGHLFLMPSQTALYGASGGVAAVVIAYAIILPDLDLVSWNWRFFAFRCNAKNLGFTLAFLSLVLLVVDRHGAVIHSAIPGGFVAGWVYVHLLGFGHPSWLQRKLARRRATAERIARMSPEEFIECQIDPLLDKISRGGIASLTRAERRLLARAREKVS